MLSTLIDAITGLAKDELKRNERVIKLLKQFNLDPEHPPSEFTGVYRYALVEYGVGKPRAILQLFRLEVIQKAFRQAFDTDNPSIVIAQIEEVLEPDEWNILQEEIAEEGIDVIFELAEFSAVFIKIVELSRTPAEVRRDRSITQLQEELEAIKQQLHQLGSPEEIQTELAKLTSQTPPLLSPGEKSTDIKCKAAHLAQQLRGWFKTLGYSFEKHQVWLEGYFEFIINIPTRRSFDRILVRGVAGEVGLNDVIELHQSLKEQNTDEGWLVTNRRISRAARDELKKEENRHLDCYTFDELIDLDADFTVYINWLESEIKHRSIDTKYVPLGCTKEEVDPITKRPIGVSRYLEVDGWIDGYIDLWLDDPVKEHISILGEFGTGKTWFAFHYAWIALERYKYAKQRGLERPRLPIVITLRDYAKALNVENVLAGFFFTQHNIRINSDVFEQLNRMGKLLLIFDGFDEMAARINRQEMINNFWELAKVVVPGAKVILTCRTEHFPEAQEGRALLNAELQASIANLTGETPQFEVLELEKFNDEQIRQVLSFQAQPDTVEQVMGNPQLLDLARRPVLTELILEALPDIEAGKPVDMSRVYLYAVRRKMERDIKAERTFTSLADKMYFLCELAWEMLSNDQMSMNYRQFPDRIRQLFGSVVQEEKDLDHWQYDMMGQTMLIRNADGDYAPAHRSLLEFFVAYKFAAELGALADDFTQLVQAQSCLDVNATPIDYTWSGYFSRNLDETGCSIPIPPLRKFTSEPLEKLKDSFGRTVLTKAVLDLMLGMVGDNEALIKIIEGTRGKGEDKVGYVGGNAATLGVKVDRVALEEKDLSGTFIKGADLSNASLCNVNFAGANLVASAFTNTLSQIFSVAFNSNGQFLAMGDAEKIHLWRVADKQKILTFTGHQNLVYSITFSPDDQILASASTDCTIKFWNVKTGRCIQTLLGHTATVRTIAFSPNNQFIASGSEDTTVKLWDIKTGECLITLLAENSLVRSVTFSPDGEILAFTSSNYTINLWNTHISESKNILQGHANCVKCIAFSPVSASSPEGIGKNLASASQDRTVKLWDVNTGKCVKTFQGHAGLVSSVAFHPNGNMLVSGSSDEDLKLWDINTGECLKTLQGHDSCVTSIIFSPDGETIISGSQDHCAKLWDINTGECIYSFQGYGNWLTSIVFNPNGQVVASGGEDHIVSLWDINTGKCTKKLQGHTNWIKCLAFSPDGQTLASCGYDDTVRLWNICTGQCTKILREDGKKAFSIAFTSDGIQLGIAFGNTIKFWDLNTEQYVNVIKVHTSSIKNLAFSSDSQILGSCSHDDTVQLWDVAKYMGIKKPFAVSASSPALSQPCGLGRPPRETLKEN